MQNRYIRDNIFPPEFHALNRAWSAYQVFSALGILLGTLLGLGLAWRLGLSLWVGILVSLGGLISIYGLALVSKLFTAEEVLINYRVQIFFWLISSLLLWVLRQPLLRYLDLAALGGAATIILGRIGCLHASCCHGRPARWGVCYGAAHVKEGLEPYLAGVRLFPVPLLASLWTLLITVAGSCIVLGGAPPGTAFGWHVVAYGVGRFGQEFLRGHSGRRYWHGFSEAQWTALLTIGALVVAGWLGWVPAYGWHVVAGVGLALWMLALIAWRKSQKVPRYKLLHADHIHEIAGGLYALAQRSTKTGSVGVLTTSLGIQISAGAVAQAEGPPLYHYTLSRCDDALSDEVANLLADLIVKLRHSDAKPQLVKGLQPGVFHFLIPCG